MPTSGKPSPEAPVDAGRGAAQRTPRASAIHQLRNHVNSLVMNAGAVAMHCPDKDVRDKYLALIEAEAQRCRLALATLDEPSD